MLGRLFTLVLGFVADRLNRGEHKAFKIAFPIYVAGVFSSGTMLLARGIFDVLAQSATFVLSKDKSASGAEKQ